MVYLGVGAVLYFALASSGTASVAWFVLLTGIILSFYGGGFATVPAYLKGADIYTLSLYLMVAVLAVGFIANLLIRPVADRYVEEGAEDEARFDKQPRRAPKTVRQEA
jgi:hypothetical protein